MCEIKNKSTVDLPNRKKETHWNEMWRLILKDDLQEEWSLFKMIDFQTQTIELKFMAKYANEIILFRFCLFVWFKNEK